MRGTGRRSRCIGARCESRLKEFRASSSRPVWARTLPSVTNVPAASSSSPSSAFARDSSARASQLWYTLPLRVRKHLGCYKAALPRPHLQRISRSEEPDCRGGLVLRFGFDNAAKPQVTVRALRWSACHCLADDNFITALRLASEAWVSPTLCNRLERVIRISAVASSRRRPHFFR